MKTRKPNRRIKLINRPLGWKLLTALLLGAAWLCKPQTTVRAQHAAGTAAVLVKLNSVSGPDIGAALATLPGAYINSVVIPQTELTAERAPAPPCNAQKIAEVLAPATASAPSVRIDCSLTLASNHVITKRLIFKGSSASRVTVEGNGATINGGSGTVNYSPSNPEDMVEIHSSRYQDPATGELRWTRPENITLRNCKIIGSVAVWGMEKWGDDGILRSSSRLSGHVTRVRNNAPRNIVLDRVTITGVGTRVPLYLHAGVSDFQMFDSGIEGSSGKHVNIYLDAESYRNTFRNNRIEATTSEREVMAVDGSSYNIIVNNFFSSLNHGGIYLYRNCGQEGIIRHSTPSHNTIVNNVFYYRQYDGDNPAIFVASRNGNRKYCDDDDGYPYGSSASNYDYAQFNVVMQNQIYKPQSVSKMIKVGRPDINTPNFINYNETVAAEIERKAGCYISNGYQKDFIRGEFINLFRNANGEPVCTGYRYTCHDGVLTQSSDSTCRPVGYADFECQASGNNSGCQKTAFSPAGKTIIGAKAACNLEFGTVSATDLNGVSANIVKVLRASDNVSQGSCTLGSTSIRSGQAAVSGINGLNRVSFGCRENDANGGDCHIKGRLYYR